MKTPAPSISFFLDRSRPGVDGKCLIKLNVYCKPDKKRYATKLHATEAEWEKLSGTNLRDAGLKKIKAELNAVQSKANQIAETIQPFSFVAFEEAFFRKASASTKSNTLKSWFSNYVTELKQNGQVGTAESYHNTYSSLEHFRKGLMLQDITPAFLKAYEAHMLKAGRSNSTIGIYLRQLRAIINQAIKGKVLSKDNYPFAEYTIPAGRNVKKALTETEIKALFNYITTDPDKQKALDFWLISYLCSGINFADIVELKAENLSGNMLQFHRAKTKRTKKKDLRPIKIGVPEKALILIRKYQNTDPDNPYLFPVLAPGLPASTIKSRTKALLKWVNLRVKQIAEELGIEKVVTTYAARHSFSTILKRKGVSTEFIKESLGHSSVLTTENYLDSFADDEKLSVSNLLTDF